MTDARLLHELLLHRATIGDQDRLALTCEGHSYTFAQLLDASQRLATVLRTGGVQRGDRVLILLGNSWASAVSIFGTLIAGGVLVLVNPQTKTDKLEFLLHDSGARALIAESRLERVFRPALRRLDQPILLLRANHAQEPLQDQFATQIRAGTPITEPVPLIPSDLAAIIYTSGSTGKPKGVMQTHQAMVFAVGSILKYLHLNRDDAILCVLPLSFDYGLYQLLMSVSLGARLVLERSFTFLGHTLERIRTETVTVIPGVPTMFASLIAAHRRAALRIPSVTRITNTAAALPDEFIAPLRQIFPNAQIYKMYGLTECKRVSYLEPELLDAKPGSVGKAIPGTEVYVLSPDGRPAAPGEIGTLYVRGPHVMLGYWNRPDLTDQMLKPGKLPGEPVLCTHDLFHMDSEGYLYFVGRTDDIIKTRGEKVSPVEVESALHRIPGVRQAVAIGIPDALLGEAICAYVIADSTSQLTGETIRTNSRQYLEPHMVPKYIVLCERLPQTPNGKIDRRQLARHLKNTIPHEIQPTSPPALQPDPS